MAAFPLAAAPCAAADLNAPVVRRDAEPIAARSPWTFNFTTYGWMSWVTGDLTVRGRTVGVEASPIDLIEALDWSGIPIWMSYAEARNGKLGLFNDIVYSKLAGSGDFAAGRPGGVVSLNGEIEADYTQATIEVGAAYEVWSSGAGVAGGLAALDILGGVRYWYQEVNLSAIAALNVGLPNEGGRVFARSGNVDWFDPFVGARLRYLMAPGQELVVRGDVGGFGVGSDFTWHVLATSNWQLRKTATHSIDAYVGYKALSVDYTQGTGNTKYGFDVLQHGPVTGLTVRF